MTPHPMNEPWAAHTVRRFAVMLLGITALFLATEAAALAGVSPHLKPVSFRDITSNILFAIGFGSPLVLQFSSLPGWREVGRTLALGVGIALALLAPWAVGHTGELTAADRELIAARVVTGLGLASILVLGWHAWRSPGAGRTQALAYLLPACVALVFTFVAGMYMDYTVSAYPVPEDALAYAADAAHGFQPSFLVGRLFAAAPLLAAVCFVLYVAPSPTLVFVYTLQLRARRPPAVDVATVLLVLLIAGYAAYSLIPVCGPAFAFGAAFPNDPPPVADVLARPPRPTTWRNGMPSLHFASVVLAYWHARPFGRWAKGVAALFVAGTLLATMGLGEHYFVDLVVALPFTLLVQAVCTPPRSAYRRQRWAALVGSGVLVVVWYLFLWYGIPELLRSRALTWTLTLVTVAAVVVLERRLYRVTMDPSRPADTGEAADGS
jgi:hypothetical protein